MTDIVNIGFAVNSGPVEKGYKRLDEMGNVAEKTEKKVTKSIDSMSGSFELLSNNIGLINTALASIGITQAIAKNKEFEKSMSSLSAITGAAGNDLEFYKQQAAEIGKTTTLSASEAVKAFQLMASAKPDLLGNAEALASVTREAVILSESTGGVLTLEEAARALGGTLNQFQLDSSKSSDVINILAASAMQGTAEIQQITESLVNTGAAANALNVSLTETVAGLQALAKNNIVGADAGTALNQVLLRLERSADKELMPSIVGLEKAIQNLSKRQMSTTELMTFFGDEAFKAAAAIIAQKDTLTQLTSTLEGTSTAYDQAATQTNNLDGDIKSLSSAVEALAIGFGEKLNPSARSATQALTEFLRNSEAIEDASTAAATVVAIGLTPATLGYVKATYERIKAELLANTQSVRTVNALGQVTVAAGSATVATNALGAATRFLLGPWGLLVAALGTAAIAYTTTYNRVEEQNKILDEQKKKLEGVTGAYKDLTDAGKASAKSQLVNQMNDLRQKSLDAQMQIQALQKNLSYLDAGGRASANKRIATLKNDVEALDGSYSALQSALAELNAQDLSGGWTDALKSTGDGDGEGLAEGAQKQIDTLKLLQKQLTMSESELQKFKDEQFVLSEVQKSIARNDAPAVTESIRKQALAYVAAKNESEELQKTLTGTDTVDLFALNQAKEYDKWIESISTTSTKIAYLRAEIEKTQDAVARGKLSAQVGEEYVNDLQAQLKSLEVNPFESMTSGAQEALSAMSGMFESGSKDAKKLAIAMQALNLVQAVGAVLNQGKGDPYTAFGRMATMAAMVASLGVSIGGLSGGFDDVAAKAQEKQGLDTWGNKSESIADATEITADATKKLVGINTDMLKALKNLGNALASAAGLVIRGNETPQINQNKLIFDYADIQNIFEPLGIEKLVMDPLGLFGKTFNKLLGGSSKVVDEGIRIVGGSITDLIDDVLVQSFQTVEYKKWKYGSTKSKTQYANLGDDVSAQVSLVLGAIAESVSAGASQIGIAASDIEERINSFYIATTKISLKGLSAEEQQKEIQAVFSKIFDDLAGDVVPFIDEFQKVGESLGETLARVATQTAIAEVMVERFGVVFGDKMADPEAFAQAADNISTLVGGVEELAELTSSFTDAFATDQQKLEIYQSYLLEQLSEIGLSLPSTTSGFYDLMNGLDATTEAGQEQIATLLLLTDTASSYYSLLEKMTDKYRDAASAMYDMDEATRRISLDAALAAARMGDFSLADELDLSSIAPSTSDFATELEYNLARAETAAKLGELSALQSGQVTVEEKQLTELQKINESIKEVSVTGSSVSSVNSESYVTNNHPSSSVINNYITDSSLSGEISKQTSILSDIKAIINNFEPVEHKSTTSISQSYESTLNSFVDNSVNSMMEMIDNSIGDLSTAITNSTSEIYSVTDKSINSLSSVIDNYASNFTDKSTSSTSSTSSEINSSINSFVDESVSSMSSVIDSSISVLSNAISNTTSEIKNFDSVIDKSVSSLSSEINSFSTAIGGATNMIQSFDNSLIDDSTSVNSSLIDKSVSSVSSAINSYTSIFFDKTTKSIVSIIDESVTSFSSAISNITSQFQSFDYSVAFEYNLARAEESAKIKDLTDLQAGQVIVQDKQLSVLEQIRDKISGSDSGVKEAIKSLENKMTKLQNEANLYLQTIDQASRAGLA